MVLSQIEVESQLIDLSAEAIKTFCEDISGMSKVHMQGNQQQAHAVTETVIGLEEHFKKKLVVVDCVKTEGALEGTLQFVFDREGLFTLAGIILGMPEQEILENREHGSLKDADSMSDAIRETGRLMASSWQSIFNEKLDGQSHFVKTNTFIGYPWDKPEETIGLAGEKELLFVSYEITIEPYPVFKCGVIFPETLIVDTSVSLPETTALTEEEAGEKPEAETEEQTDEETQGEVEAESEEKAETEIEENGNKAEKNAPIEEPEAFAKEKDATRDANATDEAGEKPEAETEEQTDEETKGEAEAESEEKAETEAKENGNKAEKNAPIEEPEASAQEKDAAPEANATDDVAEEAALEKSKESTIGGVSKIIHKMTQSSAVLPGESAEQFLAMTAEEIMQTEVVWGSPDESVQQAFAKMEYQNVGYMMVGKCGVLEGIVSRSDLTGAISPYLRPIFAKWRRSADDATLQIKIKWVMSSPVCTIKPQESLAAVMEKMHKFGGKCLPVVDQQGKVQGLVTVFDIFKVLITPTISSEGKSSTLRTSA